MSFQRRFKAARKNQSDMQLSKFEDTINRSSIDSISTITIS